MTTQTVTESLTDTPALPLRERALAAVANQRAADARRQAEAARLAAEQERMRWLNVREWVKQHFGIDADWSQGPVEADGLTLGYHQRIYEIDPASGLRVFARCRCCGFIGQSRPVASVYYLGLTLESFDHADEAHYHSGQSDLWVFDLGARMDGGAS